MKVIAAKVLDPTHLELTEPLELRSGAQVAVTVTESDGASPSGAASKSEASAEPRPLRFRQREQAWCGTHGDVLSSYAEQWVVLEGEEIIAHGEDPVELVERARERGIRSPYVFYVEPPEPGVVKIGL